MGQPPSYANSITPVQLIASIDNYDPAGYVAGVTNRLILNPASGGSTMAGLLSATNGWAVLICNSSSVDSITFTFQDSTTPLNQFSTPQGNPYVLHALTNVVIVYTVNQWCIVL